MKRIGFVILTWNSEKYIQDCLTSIFLLSQDQFSGKIIVVDNGSSDDTQKVIGHTIQQYNTCSNFTCHVISLEKNYGTTYSRNLGLKALCKKKAPIEYICILDSDTRINEKAILTLINALNNDSTCGIVGPRLHNSQMVYQRSGRNIPTAIEKIFKVSPIKMLRDKGNKMETSIPDEGTGCVSVGYLLSACWLLRYDLLKKVGCFDEKIFYAPEDVDYCMRCWKSGFKVLYCYDAEIVHEWQRISRKKFFSNHNLEHVKGLVYLFMKHHYLISPPKLIDEST